MNIEPESTLIEKSLDRVTKNVGALFVRLSFFIALFTFSHFTAKGQQFIKKENFWRHAYLSALDTIPKNSFEVLQLDYTDIDIWDNLQGNTSVSRVNTNTYSNYFPEQIGYLKNLQEIYINCSAVSIHESIAILKNLEVITVRRSVVSNIDVLSAVSSLKKIYLIEVKEVPEGLFELDQITHLKIEKSEGLDWQLIIQKLSRFEHLHTLELIGNDITNLPESIKELTSLRTLIIDKNVDLDWPSAIALINELPLLKELSLKHNFGGGQSELPKEISTLKQLESLHLSDGQFEDGWVKIIAPLNLTHLIMSNCRIELLPESIGSLQSLTSLDLSDNPALRELPESFAQLTQLKILDLSRENSDSYWGSPLGRSISDDNFLHSESLEILSRISLEAISLAGHPYKKLPEEIFLLETLEELDLSFLNIRRIPKGIETLASLKYLKLESSNISRPRGPEYGEIPNYSYRPLSLPSSLLKLEALKILDLNYTVITKRAHELINQLRKSRPDCIVYNRKGMY
ncbi:MAG: leucine-rich repeat domain-containing protein [Crocinitomicaceae bacterium]|nr:leucine-rich repeat domain-containing protein [Crocinitomicaceae bacterium]